MAITGQIKTGLAVAIFPIVIGLGYLNCQSQIADCKEHHKKEKQTAAEKYIADLVAAAEEKRSQQKKANSPPPAPLGHCSIVCSLVTKTVEDPVGLFTLVLCFMVWLQFIWLTRQEEVLIASASAANNAAEAARQSAAAYSAAERPYVFVIFQLGHATKEKLKTLPPRAVFSLCNWGRTPARIHECRGETAFCAKPPAKPKYTTDSQVSRDIGVLIPSDEEARRITLNYDYKRKLTESEIAEFYVGDKGFFFFGYVRYSDNFGWQHTRHYGFRYETSTGDMITFGGNAYNYIDSKPHDE